MSSESRLVLGTAQLGMPYGIANSTGQPDLNQAGDIVKIAWESGIRQFDTAEAYGQSESILGRVLQELGLTSQAKIITKPDPSLDHLDRHTLQRAVERSLNHLKVPALHCLMLHGEALLGLLDKGLKEILLAVVQSGKANYIGVSVYSPGKALQAIESDVIDFIQLPTNILDRRFEKAGVFELAQGKKKIIYIRSVFLQGLLTLQESNIPANLQFARPVISKLEHLARELGMKRQEMALCYVKMKWRHAHVVFGAETSEQVRDNAGAWMAEPPDSFLDRVNEAFDSVDERILNPPSWFQ